MSRTRSLLVLPLALLLALAAVATGVALMVTPAGAASSAHYRYDAMKPAPIVVTDDMFMPKSRTYVKGAVVTWVWQGSNNHNVTITGPAKFHSRTQSKGSFSVHFTKVGTYKVVCTIHQRFGMTMSIKVKAP